MPQTRPARGPYAGSTVGRNHELEGRSSTPATTTRNTEGSKPGMRGRPKGSKNKPKGLVPAELTEKMLPLLQKQLSPESFDYIEGVLKRGKPIETKRELDVMIAMLARNLMPAMVHETLPVDEGGLGGLQYRKDVTERLKILNSMLTLRRQIEKEQDDSDKPANSVLVKLVGERLDNARVGILVGIQPGAVAGDADRAGRQADTIRAVPDQVSERPLLGTGGKQE